jgi:hypothetical protein
MPSSFRGFLQSKNAKPDLRFEERDENYFVTAMLLLRLGFHGDTGRDVFDAVVARSHDFADPLASIQPGAETEAALIFVSTFLCFFAVKPAAFMISVNQFKTYFIPGFADDSARHVQLFQSVDPSFARSPLDPAKWMTVDHFFHEKKEEVKQYSY